MKAVHFGAGNIGRGFIGSLLYQTGYHTTFVDVNAEVVDLLNEKGEYRVVLADESQEELLIKNVSAINSVNHPDQVVAAIAEADIVTAAVGPNILPFIAENIANGLRKRMAENDRPLTVIACENMIGGSSFLKEKVYEKLEESEKVQFDARFGFPNAAVDRIVPNQSNEDKLMVMVEPFYEWAVDQTMIIGEKPEVDGLTYVDDLTPYIERKLFTVNTGHAVVAYLGYQAGLATIDEAMKNEEIKALVEKTLQETGSLLVKRYGFEREAHQSYIDKIMKRFANPYISDEVTRVGRSPIRKLGPNDRLVSPAKQYLELTGEKPAYLAKAIAAALVYDFTGDPEAVEIQESVRNVGYAETLKAYSKLDENEPLVTLILEQVELLKK